MENQNDQLKIQRLYEDFRNPVGSTQPSQNLGTVQHPNAAKPGYSYGPSATTTGPSAGKHNMLTAENEEDDLNLAGEIRDVISNWTGGNNLSAFIVAIQRVLPEK